MNTYNVLIPHNGNYYNEWNNFQKFIKKISYTLEIDIINIKYINKKYHKYRCFKTYNSVLDNDFEKWMLSCLHLIKHYPLQSINIKCNLHRNRNMFNLIKKNLKINYNIYTNIENDTYLTINFKELNDCLCTNDSDSD